MGEVPDITTPDFKSFVDFANSLLRLKRTELHCHPGVVAALRQAAPPAEYPPWKPPMGTIDLIVNADMEPGAWEIREDGEVIKSSKLSAPSPSVYRQAMADASRMWRDAFGTEP